MNRVLISSNLGGLMHLPSWTVKQFREACEFLDDYGNDASEHMIEVMSYEEFKQIAKRIEEKD